VREKERGSQEEREREIEKKGAAVLIKLCVCV
jgi:hypothetical protein